MKNGWILLTAALFALSTVNAATAALTNADVVNLCKSLGEGIAIAKIREAEEVAFATGVDDLVKLKQGGCSDKVVEAVLARVTPADSKESAGAPAGIPGAPRKVLLATAAGESALTPHTGVRRQIVAPFVGFRPYVAIKGLKASVRTAEKLPSILIHCDGSPDDRFWYVVAEADDDDNERSVALQGAGMFGGQMSDEPDDEDAMIECVLKDEGNGVWRLTPKKKLKAGEYGLYVPGVGLYDFGVDK